MLKIIAPPLGVLTENGFENLWEEVDPAKAGLTEADIKALIAAGVLSSEAKAPEPTPEPTPPIAPTPDPEVKAEQPLPNLDNMNVAEAIAIIHTIHDAQVLSALLAQEIAHDNRKTVIAAIQKQTDSL